MRLFVTDDDEMDRIDVGSVVVRHVVTPFLLL
jgi:hypothetical protein